MLVTRDFKVNQKDNRTSDTTDFECKLACCNSCTYCKRAAAKERRKSGCCRLLSEIKICERCFLCRSIVFCHTCNQCRSCCFRSTCKNKIAQVLGNLGSSGCQSESNKNPQRRLHSFLPDQTKLDKVTNHHKQLCKSPQEQLPDGGIACSYEKNAVKLVKNQKSLGFFNQLLLVPKQKNCWRPTLDLSNLNQFLKAENLK